MRSYLRRRRVAENAPSDWETDDYPGKCRGQEATGTKQPRESQISSMAPNGQENDESLKDVQHSGGHLVERAQSSQEDAKEPRARRIARSAPRIQNRRVLTARRLPSDLEGAEWLVSVEQP